MTLHPDIHQAIDSLVKQTESSDFFSALKQGSLDKRIYEAYLGDDGTYLHYYKIALHAVSTRATDKAIQQFFAKAANDINLEPAAKGPYQRLANSTKETLQYIDYLMHHCHENYEEALSAIFPCFYVYYQVAINAGEINSNHPYKDWFQCYQGELFVSQSKNVIGFMNAVYEDSEDKAKLLSILKDGVLLEEHFHQALMAKASLGQTNVSFSALETAS